MQTFSDSITHYAAPRGAHAMHSIQNSDISVVMFVEKKFIPDHVQFKSPSGRAHYQAILKHIVRPETVERLFAPYFEPARTRMKTLRDWPYLDGVLLGDITADHVRHLVASACGHGYSPQTVKHIRNVIGAILSHARKEGFVIAGDPVSSVELPPMARRESHHLTIAQAKQVINSMQNPERAAALLAIITGMSIKDIGALQWKHVNLSSSPLWIDGDFLPAESIASARHPGAKNHRPSHTHRPKYFSLTSPLGQALSEFKIGSHVSDPDCYVLGGNGPVRLSDLKLKPIARKLHMPWLSWQVIRRAHEDLLSELRFQLADDLIAGEAA